MSDTESIIRAIKLARIGGQDRWPFSDDDIDEILEALQLKADLETLAKCKQEVRIKLPTDRRKNTSVHSHFFEDGIPYSRYSVRGTCTDAIHAAAEAIRKGGE